MTTQKRVARIAVCCCIALKSVTSLYAVVLISTVTCGSVFCFPLYGPVLTRKMGLTMSQTNYISLGAVIGQYVAAVLFGAIADRSARLSSFCASILLTSGYTMMALSLSKGGLPPNFVFFIGYFLLVGAGTVASYLAAITTSAKSFPAYPGLAIGIPSSLFGISPLLLSTLIGIFHMNGDGDEAGEINPVKVFTFFAVLLGLVNLISAVALRPLEHPPEDTKEIDEVDDSEPSEHSPLIQHVNTTPVHVTASAFIRQHTVWIFLTIILLINGPSEVISQNLGSLSEALVPINEVSWPDHATLSSRARQIQIFSAVNTLSRITFGALSDLTSPIPAHTTHVHLPKRFTTPRLTYLQLSACLLIVASLYMAFFVNHTNQLWVLSACSGMSYGLVNVIGPSLISKVWGDQDFGRNFGILWCIGAIGPVLYGLLYGGISDHFAQNDSCKGPICFQLTFIVVATGALISLALIWGLKRRKTWSKV